MKFTVTTGDLDNAIVARRTKDICSSCIISQTLKRTLKVDWVRTHECNGVVIFTLNRLHPYEDIKTGADSPFKIEDKHLAWILRCFDLTDYEDIKKELPYEFEFNFPEVANV